MVSKPGYWTSLHGVTTLILVASAFYFLFVEHGAHILPYLPYLIILLCPLMHVFMHKGHAAGHSHKDHQHQDAEQAYRQGLEEGRKETERQRH